MKKRFKILITVILIVIAIVSICFVMLYKTKYAGYNFKNNTLTICNEDDRLHLPKRNQMDGSYDTRIDTLIIPDNIKELEYGIDLDLFNVVKIGKNFKDIYAFYDHPHFAFEVDPENPYFTTYGGALYSKNFDTLYSTPRHMASIRIHPDTKVIKDEAVSTCDMWAPIVVPQGVLEIEDDALYYVSENTPIVLPDTLTYMGFQELPRHDVYKTYFYSDDNYVADESASLGGKIKKEMLPEDMQSINSIDDIYEITNNGQTLKNDIWFFDEDYNTYYYEEGVLVKGLKRFGRRLSYFDENGVMLEDKWLEYEGNWYYFNIYGVGVENLWIQDYIKGYDEEFDETMPRSKWYYMQQDGTMATSKWIEWDNEWYYVGEDGAMYVDCETPDGYFVDSLGKRQ